MATALRTELDEPWAQIHCNRAAPCCMLGTRLGRELGAAQTAEGRLTVARAQLHSSLRQGSVFNVPAKSHPTDKLVSALRVRPVPGISIASRCTGGEKGLAESGSPGNRAGNGFWVGVWCALGFPSSSSPLCSSSDSTRAFSDVGSRPRLHPIHARGKDTVTAPRVTPGILYVGIAAMCLKVWFLAWFGHGCSGNRMLLKHERYYGLGMDALVTVCS